MKTKIEKTKTEYIGPGRPKKFDENEVLEAALGAFWNYGFDNTSMAILMEATGLNKSSLYGAFGSKEELFAKSLELYAKQFADHVYPSLSKTKLADAIESFLMKALDFATANEDTPGCMAVHGALTNNAESDFAQQALRDARASLEELLHARIKQAVKENDFPKNLNAHDYAKFISSIHSGINIQILTNATKEELKKVIKLAMIPLQQH